MQKGGGNYFNLFIQVDYMQGFVTHWALPWLNNINLHEPGGASLYLSQYNGQSLDLFLIIHIAIQMQSQKRYLAFTLHHS